MIELRRRRKCAIVIAANISIRAGDEGLSIQYHYDSHFSRAPSNQTIDGL
jgi:hypothetical protein